MKAYFSEVKAAVESGIITRDAYRALLVSPNQAGFTPLHQAANSGSLEVVRAFMKELRAWRSSETVLACLDTKAKGRSPSCRVSTANPEAKLINDYLARIKKELLAPRESKTRAAGRDSFLRQERRDQHSDTRVKRPQEDADETHYNPSRPRRAEDRRSHPGFFVESAASHGGALPADAGNTSHKTPL